MRGTLIIMAKAPMMGRSKTRLAADIGPVQAMRLYRMMMRRVIRQTQSDKWDTVLCVTPPRALGNVPEWAGLPQVPQVGGGLGDRLQAVFSVKGPTVVIGTDCPEITRADIQQAFDALKRHDAVFGPADDGGFWLIGLNGPARPGLFDLVRWSHRQTLADMRTRIRGQAAYLRLLIDVDDGEALAAWKVQA